MKFVLGIIAVVLISLTTYVYIDSNGKQHKPKEVTKVIQPKEQVSKAVPAKVTSKKVIPSKADTSVKEVVSTVQSKVTSEVEIESEIGKDLTIEGIENADVSDEQKEILYADIAYRQSITEEEVEAMSEEEAFSLIERDVKNGILE